VAQGKATLVVDDFQVFRPIVTLMEICRVQADRRAVSLIDKIAADIDPAGRRRKSSNDSATRRRARSLSCSAGAVPGDHHGCADHVGGALLTFAGL
jgi:hypothetical protein